MNIGHIKNKSYEFLLKSITLMPIFAWNDLVKTIMMNNVPGGDTYTAKAVYAIIITIISIMIVMYSDDEGEKLK